MLPPNDLPQAPGGAPPPNPQLATPPGPQSPPPAAMGGPTTPPPAPPMGAPPGGPADSKGVATGAEEIIIKAAEQVKAGAISPQEFKKILDKLGIPPDTQLQIMQTLGLPMQQAAKAPPNADGAPPAPDDDGKSQDGPSPSWEK